MKLVDIGFYTLNDERVKNTNINSQMYRCEVVLTDVCNFKCPYCQGVRSDCKGTQPFFNIVEIIDLWCDKIPLKNIRFTGGEPTLYPYIKEVVSYSKKKGIERIALSTNGSNKLSLYKELIKLGVNDFSISLDACCSSFGKEMCGGINGAWEKVIDNIREISKLSYVTLGMVFTKDTLDNAVETIIFGHSLGVSDIRIVSSAQDDLLIPYLSKIPKNILEKYPILKYRVNHYLEGRNIRGIKESDFHKCPLVMDDSAIAGKWHFPCIIYLREKGNPIGEISKNMRKDRIEWFKNHNTYLDPICRKNCLDVCIDYNNKYREFKL